MSPSEFFFPPPSPAAAPIRGRAERFPIRRIFCVGRNYEAHAKEMGAAVDREAPFYFTKASDHYAPSGSTIAYPPGTSSYHYEMELVVAIGKAGFRIAEAQALDHVFGYACGLDMTRRDLQAVAKEKRLPWDLGKDVEQSAVLGDIAPAAEIGHPDRAGSNCASTVRRGNRPTSRSLFTASLPSSHTCRRYYHLQPGDLIYTGTPEGVGPVKPGDPLEGSIEGVGTIAVTVSESSSSASV